MGEELKDMDKKQLLNYIKVSKLEIKGAAKMEEQDLRKAIVKAEDAAEADVKKDIEDKAKPSEDPKVLKATEDKQREETAEKSGVTLDIKVLAEADKYIENPPAVIELYKDQLDALGVYDEVANTGGIAAMLKYLQPPKVLEEIAANAKAKKTFR